VCAEPPPWKTTRPSRQAFFSGRLSGRQHYTGHEFCGDPENGRTARIRDAPWAAGGSCWPTSTRSMDMFASGGMGTLVFGRHVGAKLDPKPVAIKFLRPPLSGAAVDVSSIEQRF